jgi:hypothetical protein
VYLPGGVSASPEVLAQKYLSTDDSSIVDSKNSPGKGYASLGFQPSPKAKKSQKKEPKKKSLKKPAFVLPSTASAFTFGATPVSAFGAPAFGVSAPPSTFGAPPTPAYSAPTFGAPSAPSPASSAFGVSTFGAIPPSFGSTPAVTFGATSTIPAVTFGATPSLASVTPSASPLFGSAPSLASVATYSSVHTGPSFGESTNSSTGFYPLDNNALRRQLEEARKESPQKRKKAPKSEPVSGIFGPQPGSYDIPVTPSRQHTFDAGLTPPQSPSLKAFSTFADTPQKQPTAYSPFTPATQTPSPNLAQFDAPVDTLTSSLQQQLQQQQQLFALLQQQTQSSLPTQAPPTVVRVGGVPPNPATPTTKLLLLIALLSKKGMITDVEKGCLKDLTLSKDELVCSALEVFEIDQDLTELADTLRRICKQQH